MSATRVFGIVLGSYLALTVLGLVLLVGGGLGPDVVATVPNRVGSAILGVLFFPLEAIHRWFFFGQLPGSDWLWILGVGSCYAGAAAGAFKISRRARRR
jgi:hypothetical protein